MTMGAEKNFENRVKKFLKESGCWFLKYWSGGAQNGKKFTKDGIPDILCCCEGLFLGIELKAPKGRPSDLQLYHLRKIDEAGGLAVLLYPKDYDTFRSMILALCDDHVGVALVHYEILKERWCENA